MADQPLSLSRQPCVRIAAGVLVFAAAGVGVWLWTTAGANRPTTARVDAPLDADAARRRHRVARGRRR